jgi:hypothetical protein
VAPKHWSQNLQNFQTHLQQVAELLIAPQQRALHCLHATRTLPVQLLDVLVPEAILANLQRA